MPKLDFAAGLPAKQAVVSAERGEYPNIDMVFTPDGYFRKDGTPYPTERLP